MRTIPALVLLVWASNFSVPANAISNFQHIILIVQENRTPGNLFYALCLPLPSSVCSTTDSTKYDIQTTAWLDKSSSSGTTNPTAVLLASDYDLDHSHGSFVLVCDRPMSNAPCKMDGAAGIHCSGADNNCPDNPQFKYVDDSSGVVGPYLTLARGYGWANLMFQTNQGPSFPAHQFLFGATSAPSQQDDTAGTFVSENYTDMDSKGGCISRSDTKVEVIGANGIEMLGPYPCFEHRTLIDLSTSLSWRYYATNVEYEGFNFGELWNAPLAINHICVPQDHVCTGAQFQNNVDLNPSDVLTDIQSSACNLANVLWVTPIGQNSDHALYNTGGGPSWVASVVNAVGQSTCNYWLNTAIVVLWDDWGGWYDHESPTFLPYPQGAYQYGFRVPMIFISAYTPQGYIDNNRSDFGTVSRFIEYNFGIPVGSLGFADSRGDTTQRLQGFYNLQYVPRPFIQIAAPRNADWFIHDKSPPLPPDDD